MIMIEKEEVMQKLGDWIAKTTEQIGDFASREIPPFIHEYLQWKFYENVISIVFYFSVIIFMIGLIVATFKLSVYGFKKHKENRHADWDALHYISGIACLTLSILSLVFFPICFPLNSIKNCVQIKIAPKVYLLEQSVELYKKNK